MFDPEKCKIPTVYCGKKSVVPKAKKSDDFYYTRAGVPYECLKKGFGAGFNVSETQNLPDNSLRKIKYVGETYTQNFSNKNINDLDDLLKYSNTHNKPVLEKFLKTVFKKKDGVLDKRAYNSTLMYLFTHGTKKSLPSCKKI